MHAAACADEMREDRRVVAASGADLKDGFALLDLLALKPISVRAGHADIEAALGIESKQQVLIEEGRIVVRGFHVGMATEREQPGPRPGERLAPDRPKGVLDARIAELGRRADQFGKESP